MEPSIRMFFFADGDRVWGPFKKFQFFSKEFKIFKKIQNFQKNSKFLKSFKIFEKFLYTKNSKHFLYYSTLLIL